MNTTISMGLCREHRTASTVLKLAALAFAAFLAACSGSTGPQGAAGAAGAAGATGPAGPTGPVTALDITSASSITGTITSVTITGQPVVNFQLVDQNGAPLKGLPAADIGWVIAKLTPGTNGSASTWTAYTYKTATPNGCPAGVAACLTAPTTQPTTESGTAGTLVDNGDGSYVYTFAKNVTTDPVVTYDSTLTHRVAFEIRGLAQANNGAYTFQPSTGATTNIFTREIVETQTCDGCHGFLNAHGGARVEVRYCAMCHSPQNTDPYSGNVLDLKRMIHKIHTGINLPSINPPALPAQNTAPVLGQGFWVVGYGESLNNFNTVLFPQDTRNCQTCHVQGLAAATEAGNYASVPTLEACGSCHDNVNFATGAGHSTNIVANDTQCATCHGPTSNIDNGQLQVVNAHTIPDVVAAASYQFNVNSVTVSNQAGTIYPVVNISVTNPKANNTPYNILTDPTFVGNGLLAGVTYNGVAPTTGTTTPVCQSGSARLALDIAWETSDYTNWGSAATPAASSWGQPVSVNPLVPGAGGVPAGCSSSTLAYGGTSIPATPAPNSLYGPLTDGSFTVVGPALPPAPAATCANGAACAPIQNLAVVFEGHPGVVTAIPTSGAASADRIGVKTVVGYGNVNGAPPVARRTIVDIEKCDGCHSVLQLHGNNRNDNPQACVACHNPASTDVSQRQALTAPGVDGLWEQTIDFKRHIHEIHSQAYQATQPNYSPWLIYGYGGSVSSFSTVVFPQDSGNCYACHSTPASGPTFYPGDSLMQATTTDTGLSKNPSDATTPGNPIATTPTMAACSGCHGSTPLALSHMEQNGGSTQVTKDAEGRMIPSSNPAGVETCVVCHGPGGLADVGKVHNVIVPASSN